MRRLKIFAALAVMAVIGAGIATYYIKNLSGATGTVNTLGTEGVAIRGYDPVAYFTKGAPQEGKPEFAVDHQGATWRFASREHKALFEADPAKYTPAYGGYCAFGLASGYKAKIEPEAFTITDGKLYLNYNQAVRDAWRKDIPGFVEKADANWIDLGG